MVRIMGNIGKFSSINPATEETLEEFDFATEAQAKQTIVRSRKAFHDWKEKDISERTQCLSRIADKVLTNKASLAKTITLEMGKPIKQSRAEIEKCVDALRYFANNAKKMLEDEPVKNSSSKSYVAFDPLGVVFAIMPWNFPWWQVIRCAAPALAAGNVIILKHSSYVPKCSIEIERVFIEAGVPEYTFKSILADSSLAEKIISSDIDAVSFTGSVNTGARIAELAGSSLKKVVLELGGSDPFVVLDDADIDFAASNAVTARMRNNGQSCVAAKRFIVDLSIVNEFTERFVKKLEALRIGDPLNPQTDVGPLIRGSQRSQMQEFVQDAVSKGAKILTGGKPIPCKGFFFEPTVLTSVDQSMRVLSEETFGPISPIIAVQNKEEAIQQANNTVFGLGASVWGTKGAEEIARRINSGTVSINRIVASNPRLPFGGVRKSGIGRELSRYGLLEFTNIKTIDID
jgi:succinate-semialdehyde dehydrogenase/glutarate-semialdehyde dehydrogenase